ncbi:PREDICTED: solute carrier family 35 member F6-like, partial [Rhagoletis zephyria]|uniref:solute carrier family 35 member F6-like n=1 Tax=Rhagoletis zephyria TaxID=28612 RepID=UPI0008119CCD
INTLATKWADDAKSKGINGKLRPFNHPFLQAVAMFFGEFLCFLAYKGMYLYYKKKDYTNEMMPDSVRGSTSFSPFIFLPPALCDMTATSLMYIGLILTSPSSFQMLRGALIVFTGLLSVAFLGRRLKIYEWLGILLVICGLVIVGLSNIISGKDSHDHALNKIITGDLLIIMAQIITATQMIVEEKFVSGSNVSPLQAVGWEGIFGFSVLSVLLVPMYFIHVGKDIFQNPDGQIEDALDGFVQIGNNWQVALGLSGTILSIAFFNFAGISVTKQMNATTRTVLDSVRTLVIWVISLILKWEVFSWIQLGGFIVLIIGMCVYNDILFRPTINKYRNKDVE